MSPVCRGRPPRRTFASTPTRSSSSSGRAATGLYHYLIVLKATDEAQMATHSEAMLNDYLDTAPAAATLTGVYHRKLHYGRPSRAPAATSPPTTASSRAASQRWRRRTPSLCRGRGVRVRELRLGDGVDQGELRRGRRSHVIQLPEAAHTDDKRGVREPQVPAPRGRPPLQGHQADRRQARLPQAV